MKNKRNKKTNTDKHAKERLRFDNERQCGVLLEMQ